MTPTVPPALPNAVYERGDSVREYEAMLDELIAQTQSVIRIFSKSLPPSFNSEARCAALRQFLRADPANRLYVIVHEIDELDRTCPRVVTLLQRFSHAAKLRRTPRWARHVYDAFAIFDASHYLHRFHHAHMRYARGLNELEGAQQLLERYGELWEASQPGTASDVLGL